MGALNCLCTFSVDLRLVQSKRLINLKKIKKVWELSPLAFLETLIMGMDVTLSYVYRTARERKEDRGLCRDCQHGKEGRSRDWNLRFGSPDPRPSAPQTYIHSSEAMDDMDTPCFSLHNP